MFVVLDEQVERRLSQLAAASPTGPTPLLALTATHIVAEDLVVVGLRDQGPDYLTSIPGVTLPCYGFALPPDRDPIYPAGAAMPGAPPLLLVAVAPSGPPALRAFFFFHSDRSAFVLRNRSGPLGNRRVQPPPGYL